MLVQSPYRMVWSGEFEEMEQAEATAALHHPAVAELIFILLYMAFHSLLDAVVVFTNVVALSLGGIWALLLTDTNFSISAAVGFVSLFGVAIMDGLLLISSFNSGRAQRHAAATTPSCKVPRSGCGPVMMTALTAVLGLLPGGPVDEDRLPDAAAAGHRRGRRHADDAVPDALPDAGAVQLLRPPRAAGRRRRPGPLMLDPPGGVA